MLALSLSTQVVKRHASRARTYRSSLRPSVGQPRTFTSDAIQKASEGFLDLALAIPFPEYIPPYSGTIILLTVATRLVFTVPFSIWVGLFVWAPM
jgi:mitochondrial inner membrane protein COX18